MIKLKVGRWVLAALLSGAVLAQAFVAGWPPSQDAPVVANSTAGEAISLPDFFPRDIFLTSSEEQPEKRVESEKPASSGKEEAPTEPVEKRIVPVISLGDGARIGAVQVGGPRSYVEQVKVVVLLEGDYKDIVRYRVLIPIKTEKVVEKIERVPFVAVTGIVDLKVS